MLALFFTLIFLKDLQIYIGPLIFGWGISFSSVIIGGYIVTNALKGSSTGFINTVLLSMVVRMLITVSLIFVLIYFLKIDKISLAVIFFFFYFLFLILEINYLSDKSNNK